MRSTQMKLWGFIVLAVVSSWAPSRPVALSTAGRIHASPIGPLTFGPDGTLFAADNQGAASY